MITYLLVPIIFLSNCASQPASILSQHQQLEQKIDALVKKYEALDIFSGVVLVAEQGKPFYHKAFGLADRSNKIPNSTQTLFDIGSMNKTMTSIVIHQLADEGKLSLENKLIQYIQGFDDPAAKDITITHLLSHQSGFGDYYFDGFQDALRSEKTIAAITDRAKHMELLFPPGEESEYSNTGYILLGAIIEKVSGKTYHQNVKERIVVPLKLKNTYIEDLDRVRDRQAIGYLKTVFGELETNDATGEVPNPDGGFLATTADVLKFYRSFYYDDVLFSAEAKAKSRFFQYFNSLTAGETMDNAGGYEGWNTSYLEVIGKGISIVVFANMDEPVAEQLSAGILSLYQGEEAKSPKLPAMQNVRIAYETHGADYVKKNFVELTSNFHPTDPKDLILNQVGYAYLYGKKTPDKAVEIFRLNTELFPDVANIWDSLGEGYRQKGDIQEAIASYKRALELDPKLSSAQEALKELVDK